MNVLTGQVKQAIPHTTAMFYGDCVKMCEDFAKSFGEKRTVASRQRTTFLFHQASF
jgi:hypothetical protein